MTPASVPTRSRSLGALPSCIPLVEDGRGGLREVRWAPIPAGADCGLKPRGPLRITDSALQQLIASNRLTRDPAVAAQPPELIDYAWRFPYGAHWNLHSQVTCLRLYRQSGRMFRSVFAVFRDPKLISAMGALDEHPLFLLHLDLEYFRAWLDDPDDHPRHRAARLQAYLLMGREDWGDGEELEDGADEGDA